MWNMLQWKTAVGVVVNGLFNWQLGYLMSTIDIQYRKRPWNGDVSSILYPWRKRRRCANSNYKYPLNGCKNKYIYWAAHSSRVQWFNVNASWMLFCTLLTLEIQSFSDKAYVTSIQTTYIGSEHSSQDGGDHLTDENDRQDGGKLQWKPSKYTSLLHCILCYIRCDL